MSQDNTSTDDSAAGITPELAALIPSGSEIYDSLMEPIEPELLSNNLPVLAEKYKDESEPDRVKRMEKYSMAFAEYDKAYEKWIKDLRGAVKLKRSEACRVAEEEQKEEDSSLLTDLESQFENTNPSPK